MNLSPREKDKLLVSMAAMVARRRLERGVKLNHPEAIALITDFIVEGARDGRSVAELMQAGAEVLDPRAVHGRHRRDDPRHPGRSDLSRRHQARHRAPADPVRRSCGFVRKSSRSSLRGRSDEQSSAACGRWIASRSLAMTRMLRWRVHMIPGELFIKDGEIELNAGRADGDAQRRQHRRPADPGRLALSFLRNQSGAAIRPREGARHAARHRRRHRGAVRAGPEPRGAAGRARRQARRSTASAAT